MIFFSNYFETSFLWIALKCLRFFIFCRIFKYARKLFIQYSGAVFLFLIVSFCQLFLFSNKWSRPCGEDKYFSSSSSGFGSLSGHNCLWFHWHLSEIQIVPMAQSVGQRGSEALGTGSNPSLYLHFFKLFITTENRDPPTLLCFLCMKVFDTRIFLKPRRVPLRNFSVLWDKKKFDGKSCYSLPPPPLLIHKSFRYRKFSETLHRRAPLRDVSVLRHKLIDRKSLYSLPPPSLLSIKVFDTKNFLKHREVPLRIFLAPWDKKNQRKFVMLPLLDKIQKSVVELMFVENLWKLNSKQ